jgi:hypothetical protein
VSFARTSRSAYRSGRSTDVQADREWFRPSPKTPEELAARAEAERLEAEMNQRLAQGTSGRTIIGGGSGER